MFKPSSRCVQPHVNLEVVRNKLFGAGFCSAVGADTAEKLIHVLEEVRSSSPPAPYSLWLPLLTMQALLRSLSSHSLCPSGLYPPLQTNKSLGARPAGAWPLKVSEGPLAKARLHGFYLGLDSYRWVDDVIDAHARQRQAANSGGRPGTVSPSTPQHGQTPHHIFARPPAAIQNRPATAGSAPLGTGGGSSSRLVGAPMRASLRGNPLPVRRFSTNTGGGGGGNGSAAGPHALPPHPGVASKGRQ